MKPFNTSVAVMALCLTFPGWAAAEEPTSKDVIKSDGSRDFGGRFTGFVEGGFDSFQEKYSIIDADTLDSVREFRTRFGLGYTKGTFLKNFIQIEGRALIGDDTYEANGRLKLAASPRWARFGFNADVTGRSFREQNTTYSFANDYIRYYLHTYLKKNLNPSWSIRLTDRLVHQNFDKRTEFDYDFARNNITITSDFERSFTIFTTTGLQVTTMSIPDSSQIEYTSYTPLVELRIIPEIHKRFGILGRLERRNYTHEPTRSSFWSLLANASAEWPLTSRYSITLDNDVQYYTYDVNTNAYFDYTENRARLLLNFNQSWSLRVGAGPTYGFFVSGFSKEDEYQEWGGMLAFEYIRTTRLWLSASYEVGQRRYDAFGQSTIAEPSIYSDYVYNRITTMANAKLGKGVGFSLFLDYSPEDHEREGDDATATLFSVTLNYAF